MFYKFRKLFILKFLLYLCIFKLCMIFFRFYQFYVSNWNGIFCSLVQFTIVYYLFCKFHCSYVLIICELSVGVLLSPLYQLVFHYFLGCLPLRNSLCELQSDDVKLYDNQSDYWRTFLVSDDIAVKHGWRNSRILKASSQGLGKLMASLTYFTGDQETKEVLALY
jgi:hypothetical protein